MRKTHFLKSHLVLCLFVLIAVAQTVALQGDIDLTSRNSASQVWRITGSYIEKKATKTNETIKQENDPNGGEELEEEPFDGLEINQIGGSFNSIGDINSDGFDDIIIINEGQCSVIAYVIYGSASRNESSVDVDHLTQQGQGFRIFSSKLDSLQSISSSSGDFNNDGVSDFVIGFVWIQEQPIAYVIYGQPNRTMPDLNLTEPLDISHGFRILGNPKSPSTGKRIAFAGDVNGDGIDDIIASSSKVYFSKKYGSVCVIYGSQGGTRADIDLLATFRPSQGFCITGEKYSEIGYSVGGAGDVNGDGIADIIIKSLTTLPSGESGPSVVHVIYGKLGVNIDIDLRQPLDLSQGFWIRKNTLPADIQVKAAGDVNGDGVDDLLISQKVIYSADYDLGLVHVVYGKKGGLTTNIDLAYGLNTTMGWTIRGRQSFIDTGESMSSLKDVNQDGIDDFIFTSSMYMSPSDARIIYGKSGGIPS